MKALIVVLLIIGVFYLGKLILGKYKDVERTEYRPAPGESTGGAPEPTAPKASALAGLPANLEPALAAAEKQGAAGLKNFLVANSRFVQDPRLADIELDYCVLLSRQDPDEAKRIFQAIKARVPTTSPVYARIQKLDRTFQ